MDSRPAASASWLDLLPSRRERRKRILLTALCLVVSSYLQIFYAGPGQYQSTTANAANINITEWVSLSKIAMRRMRIGGEPIEPIEPSPYTAEALDKNPHLGWQPSLVPAGANFTWRDCFKEEAQADPKKKGSGSDRPPGCREHPSEFGEAPAIVNASSWIPDATMVRTMFLHGKDRDGNAFPPPLPEELLETIADDGTSEHGDGNEDCLRESNIRPTGSLKSNTVTITPSNHYGVVAKNQTDTTTKSIEVPAPKVMCLVYTMEGSHATRIRGIRDTWAGGCDGFLAFSTKSDPRIPAISLPHDGPESYNNMWQKVRSIWKFVGAHYLEEYDWFYIGGDDLFALPHNLKTYLAYIAHKHDADPKTKEYFVGRRFNQNMAAKAPAKKDYFHSGGPGYSLSRAALRKLLTVVDDVRKCSARVRASAEDVMMSRCLHLLGANVIDTRDARGRERFHHFSPGWQYHWKVPKPPQVFWYERYNNEWGTLSGKDCCAPDSGSFHYIVPAAMRHMQALLDSSDEGWRSRESISVAPVEKANPVVAPPPTKMKVVRVTVTKVESTKNMGKNPVKGVKWEKVG